MRRTALLLVILLLSSLVDAQGTCQVPPSDYLGRFECLVGILLCLLMYLTPPVVLFMLVLGGVRFTSDDTLKRKEGKQVIILAVGGAVLVAVLLGVASAFVGIDLGMCWDSPEMEECSSKGGTCMEFECSNYEDCDALYGSCSSGNCCNGACTTKVCTLPEVLEFEVMDA